MNTKHIQGRQEEGSLLLKEKRAHAPGAASGYKAGLHASRMLHTPILEELGPHMTAELPRAFLCLYTADTSMALETDKSGSVPRLPFV